MKCEAWCSPLLSWFLWSIAERVRLARRGGTRLHARGSWTDAPFSVNRNAFSSLVFLGTSIYIKHSFRTTRPFSTIYRQNNGTSFTIALFTTVQFQYNRTDMKETAAVEGYATSWLYCTEYCPPNLRSKVPRSWREPGNQLWYGNLFLLQYGVLRYDTS